MKPPIVHCFVFLLVLSVLQSCRQPYTDDLNTHNSVKVGVVVISEMNQVDGVSEYLGTVEANSTVDMGFNAGGRITSILVKEGQLVRKGQLLATIDKTSAYNSFAAAKSTFERAQDAYNRAKQVYDKGSLPEVKFVEIQTQLAQAQSLYSIAEKNLSDCSLHSPTNATVSKRFVEVGSIVSPMQTIVRLVDMSTMCVKMSVPENDINNISLGDTVSVVVAAADSTSCLGIVYEKDITADAISHSYLAKVQLLLSKSQATSLLPGMVCRVSIRHSARLNQPVSKLIVPNRAVQVDNNGRRFVWAVDDSSCAQKRYVDIGDLNPDGVVITAGLSLGDIIVTDGTQKISSGSILSY